MAVQTDIPLFADLLAPHTFALSDITLANAYCMIGDIRLHVLDQTAEIEVYVYLSEAARRQDMTIPHEQRRPVKTFTIHAPFATYTQFLEGDVKALVASAYLLLKTMPEPHGLKSLVEKGEEI